MKVTSFAVQLLPGERGDWRLPTHRELVIVASAAPARRSPQRTRDEPLRWERAMDQTFRKQATQARYGVEIGNPPDPSTLQAPISLPGKWTAGGALGTLPERIPSSVEIPMRRFPIVA